MHTPTLWTVYVQRIFLNDEYLVPTAPNDWTMSNEAIKYVGKGTQNTKNKVRHSSIYVCIT